MFFDRDGVINRAFIREGRPYPPASLREFELLPGVLEAVNSLSSAGFLIVVVTNQPDVATGIQEKSVVEDMQSKIEELLPINAFKVCYHQDKDDCSCRKPKPGMLLEAACQCSIDLQHSYMVGDRWRDIEAGNSAGCKTILIERGYFEKKAEDPTHVVTSISEASALILSGLAGNNPKNEVG